MPAGQLPCSGISHPLRCAATKYRRVQPKGRRAAPLSVLWGAKRRAGSLGTRGCTVRQTEEVGVPRRGALRAVGCVRCGSRARQRGREAAQGSFWISARKMRQQTAKEKESFTKAEEEHRERVSLDVSSKSYAAGLCLPRLMLMGLTSRSTCGGLNGQGQPASPLHPQSSSPFPYATGDRKGSGASLGRRTGPSRARPQDGSPAPQTRGLPPGSPKRRLHRGAQGRSRSAPQARQRPPRSPDGCAEAPAPPHGTGGGTRPRPAPPRPLGARPRPALARAPPPPPSSRASPTLV